MIAATAEKPKGDEKAKELSPAEVAAEQLAARVRGLDSTQTVSGKDVAAWSDAQRKSVAKLLDKPCKFPWEVHDKFPDAVSALGKTKTERLAAIATAKRLEAYERLESDLDEAIAAKLEAFEEMQARKAEASEANKAYSEAKEEYEHASSRVIAVAENKKNRQLPLPMEVPKKAAAVNGKASGNGKAGEDPAAKTRLDAITDSKRVINACEKAGIETVRQLITAMNANVEHWWRDIKGLGETGYDEIQLAMAGFWKANPDLKG